MLEKTLAAVAFGVMLAGGAVAQSFAGAATCQLTNTAENAALYEATCTVTQSESGENTIFEGKMGDSEPFLFAGRRGQTNSMQGPEEVVFTDLPDCGIFRWSDFALAIAE